MAGAGTRQWALHAQAQGNQFLFFTKNIFYRTNRCSHCHVAQAPKPASQTPPYAYGARKYRFRWSHSPRSMQQQQQDPFPVRARRATDDGGVDGERRTTNRPRCPPPSPSRLDPVSYRLAGEVSPRYRLLKKVGILRITRGRSRGGEFRDERAGGRTTQATPPCISFIHRAHLTSLLRTASHPIWQQCRCATKCERRHRAPLPWRRKPVSRGSGRVEQRFASASDRAEVKMMLSMKPYHGPAPM